MNCIACTQPLPTGVRFCGGCGMRVAVVDCRGCGAANASRNSFCDQCGAALERTLSQGLTAAARAGSTGPGSPADTTGTTGTTSTTDDDGERKQLTVLFADLRGSMELLADADPEVARRLLDGVIERMREAVLHFGGTVNQVMGDGIMALFGAPRALEDHALRACGAALRMQQAVTAMAAAMSSRAGGARVAIRVGINSGEVVVRAVGAAARADYTAVGRATHLAARMEQLAAPGSVVLGAATHALVEGRVELRALGAQPVKGLAEPVPVYELLGLAPARAPLVTGAVCERAPFVGRGDELAALRDTFDAATAGRAQAITVVGEPGNGKSRLLHEALGEAAGAGWHVLVTGAGSHGLASPYRPWLELLQAQLGIDAEAGHAGALAALAARLDGLEPGLGAVAGPLAGLFGGTVEDAGWSALDAPAQRRASLDGVGRWLRALARSRPLVLVVENLHWADGATLAFLDAMVAGWDGGRLVVLGTARPEFRAPWAGQPAWRELHLAVLPVASALRLVHALIGTDPGVAALAGRLLERTGGNPFFIEECARTLFESGALVRRDGVVRVVRPLDRIEVPATVQAVLAARIDRLAPADKQLLQVAAVIGRDIVFDVLQAAAAQPAAAVRSSLARLADSGLLHETAAPDGGAYVFRHALTQSVADGGLLSEARRTLHERALNALLTRHGLAAGAPAGEHADELARHAVQAQRWAEATDWLREAGDRAAARCAYRESAACIEQALDLLERLPESAERSTKAIDLLLALRLALMPLGRFDDILRGLHRADALARAGTDELRRGRVAACLSASYWWSGQPRAALEAASRAREAAAAAGAPELVALAAFYTGQVRYTLADHATALDALDETQRRAGQLASHERGGISGLLGTLACTWQAFCRAETGDFDAALASVAEGQRGLGGQRDSYFRIVLDSAEAYCLVLMGEPQRAIGVLEPIRERTVADFPAQAPQIDSRLALAYLRVGRAREAAPMLEACTTALRSTFVTNLPLQLAWWAEALLETGEVARAREVAAEALALARRIEEPGNEAWAQRAAGRIEAAAARQLDGAAAAAAREASQAAFAAALEAARRLGMRPLQASVLAALEETNTTRRNAA